VSLVVEKVIESLVPVIVRIIENGLASGEHRAEAWKLVADIAKLRASAQRKLNERRAKP